MREGQALAGEGGRAVPALTSLPAGSDSHVHGCLRSLREAARRSRAHAQLVTEGRSLQLSAPLPRRLYDQLRSYIREDIWFTGFFTYWVLGLSLSFS